MPSSSPGFRVVTAPRLEPLFARLAATFRDAPLDPTARETIVVAQNVGLRRWVERGLARDLGVAASLDLRSPRELTTDLARRLAPGDASDDRAHPFEAAGLAWRIRAVLDDLPADPAWAPVRAYLDRTAGQTMPLATRLAALFDDYQVYRPDVLVGWGRGARPPDDFPHGGWQAALWQRLVAQETGTRDRATEMLALLDALADPPDGLLAHVPSRVAVFGALLVPPVHLRAVHALARHVPVTVYAVVPGDAAGATHAHPLLRALAGRTRDYWSVLGGLGGVERERLPCESPPETALGGLQAALATDTCPPAPTPIDATVRVHDCHSPTRELEALRDTLLDAFAEVDGLRPSDVLVLVPDLATYAPLVDAVFGAEEAAPGPPGTGGVRIPYHVVDHPHAPALRVVEAFGRALRLHDGRVTASELLDLLGTPAIRRAAGIAEDELPRLRAWVRESGVCWGLTAERRARFDVPEDDLHTWRFGLDRLLLGVMTGDAGGGLVLGHLPCDVVGAGGADLLGRFCEWAEALFASLDAIDRPAPLDAWPGRILTFLDGVFDAREDEELAAVVFLREQALALDRLHGVTGREGPVSFRAVRAHLDGAAGRFERREPYLTGKVTVAHPLALRHAPHRVVAVLGLNDGVWPRPDQPAGFDLVTHAPQPGDASPRDHEKQLFLDAVMAARDRLVLSFVGRSQKDNAERAASVCLDAFLDAARLHWAADAEALVVRHRLQPFAADYFTPGGPLASYARQHRVRAADGGPPVAFLDPARRLASGEAQADVLTLRDLADAWVNPSRHVARRRLRLSLDLDDDALHDDEPVVLDALERYHLRAAVLEGLLDGLDDDALAVRVERSGKLPAGAPGASWLRRALDEARPVADAVRRWGPTEPVAIDVQAGDVRLVGTLDRVGERGGLRVRPGKVRGKHTVEAWVDHLALCATRPAVTCAVGTDDTAVHFAPVGDGDARKLLAALARGYRRAHDRSLPLYEKASEAYAGALSRSSWEDFTARVLDRGAAQKPFEPHVGAMTKARRQFSDPWNDFTDDADAYVALATRGRPDPFEPEAHFAKWALCLWAPLLTYKRPGVPE